MLRDLWNAITYRSSGTGPDLAGRSMVDEFGPPRRDRHRHLVESLGTPTEVRAYVTRAEQGPLSAHWVAVWHSPNRKGSRA